jgi:hypothetical protein
LEVDWRWREREERREEGMWRESSKQNWQAHFMHITRKREERGRKEGGRRRGEEGRGTKEGGRRREGKEESQVD